MMVADDAVQSDEKIHTKSTVARIEDVELEKREEAGKGRAVVGWVCWLAADQRPAFPCDVHLLYP
jgi:hypothetical protein